MGIPDEFADILKSLVFITEIPWINFSLVLSRDAMTVQPRETSWPTKNVGKISGPFPV